MENWKDYYYVLGNKLFRKGGTPKCKVDREVKSHINKGGYKTVGVSFNGKHYKKYLHRLIALYFIPNPDNLEMVDHIDRNKLNNDVSNLRWASRSQNSLNSIIKLGKSGEKCISIDKCGGYLIEFKRNKQIYRKYLHKTSSLEEAVLEREL